MKSYEWGEYDGSFSVEMKVGFDLFLRPKCEYSRKRFLYRTAESNELDLLVNKSFENLICFDVGANVGYWSVWLLNRGVKELHSFEPDQKTFNILKKNVMQYTDITRCNNLAIGQNNGSIDLYINNQHSGDNRPLPTDGRTPVSVEAITIDHYCERHRIEHVDFVKIDIQGGEEDALVGAKRILEESRPTIFIEIAPESVGVDADRFVGFLASLLEKLDMIAYCIDNGDFRMVSLDGLSGFRGNLIINQKTEWLS